MKKITLPTALIVLSMMLLACGSNKTGNINGNWSASLTDTGGAQVFTFTTSVAESSNGTLSISNFHFTTDSPCFVSDEVESGTFGASGDFNGNVAGQFGMTIQSGSPSGNTLVLSGQATGNTITGTWTLTGGSGCSGNGAFSMTKM